MKEMIKEWCARIAAILVVLAMFVICSALFTSCTRTAYVPVKEVQTVFQNHTDTVHRTDSIIKETERIVMQLDSSAMAEYGIRLSNAEKAWLVREKQLENKINKLLEKKADTVIVRDTIPQPYPVKQELSRLDKVYMALGEALAVLCTASLIAGLVYFIIRRKLLAFVLNKKF